ncbi:MAG: hypothetical protein KDA44_12320 [Planctomycetales bacterium]|nr:hypothetical protein [Planctomycetales bacterium]
MIDWFPTAEWDLTDSRVVRRRSDGLARLTSISHLRVFRAGDDDGASWTEGQSFLPDAPEEEFGAEDPRVTEIQGRFWITYVAVSRHGAATSLASTDDFETFVRHGVIFCPENKDVVLFPAQIDGQYAALHRPTGGSRFSSPEIWLARSPDLFHWGRHEPVLSGCAPWEAGRVGSGPPPIRVENGWLAVYHGAGDPRAPGSVGEYCAGAVLLDHCDPSRVLRRSPEPIMRPTADFERTGFVGDVVFPTGLIERGDKLRMYYGSADSNIGSVEFCREELLASLC